MPTSERVLLAFLASALVQVTLVAAAGAGAAWIARRAPARHRHALWIAALALAVLLPSWTVFGEARRASSPAFGTAGVVAAPDAPTSTIATAGPSTGAWAPARRVTMSRLTGQFLIGGFALLLALQAARLARSWQRARVLLGAASPAIPPLVADLADRCREALRLGPVPVLVSSRVPMPLTVGALRPAIVLPTRLVESASPDLITAALGHEMAHVRRRDFGVNLALEILSLPIAFHPGATWLRRERRQAREQACDELVTSAVQDPRTYARALVTLARWLAPGTRPSPALGLFGDHSFEERVMRLLSVRPVPGSVGGRILFTAAALVLAATAAIAPALAITVGEREATAVTARSAAAATETADLPRMGADPRPGEYTYDSGAKRDPFMDLRTREPRIVTGHDPTHFLIQEIALRGVVKSRTGWTALILGPDGRTYFVSVGQGFQDGTLRAVDASGMTVQQEVRDPLAPPRTRELRLALHPDND